MDNEHDARTTLDRRDFFKTAGAGLTAAAVMMTPREAALAQEAAQKAALDRIATNTYPIRPLFKSRFTAARPPEARRRTAAPIAPTAKPRPRRWRRTPTPPARSPWPTPPPPRAPTCPTPSR